MRIEFNRFILFIFVLTFPLLSIANTELPDPTRPVNFIADNVEPVFFEEVEEDIKWTVSAIRISKDDKTAIINGKLVRVGDDVGPAKVLEIKPLSVVIDHESRKLIVRLFNNPVIKDYKASR